MRFDFSPPPPWEPLCMEPDEWATWQRHEAGRPCDECPIAFAIAMRAEHRCNGIPHDGKDTGGRKPRAMDGQRVRWRDQKRRQRERVR